MKQTIIIILLFFSISSYSQSTEFLDTKNGFKNFKFGDSFDKHLKNLELKFESDKDVS
mgnify:CR=1 FL=1